MDTKKCTKCKKVQSIDMFCTNRFLEDGKSIWCRSCRTKSRMDWYRRNKAKHHAAQKRWYEKRGRIRYEKVGERKREIYREVRKAVKNGTIKKTSCVICGKLPTEGHHSDYGKPLDVIWLCIRHHNQAHARK